MAVLKYTADATQAVGDRVNARGSVYVCTTPGRNAGTLTGSETGTGIQDGGAVWSALGPAMVSIPLRNDLPFFDLQVDLEKTTYTLQLRWNVRLSAWFLTIYDGQGINVLLGDCRAVVGFPIAAYISTRQPPGLFIFLDTSGKSTDPGLTDLGSRVQLLYLTAAGLGL